MVYLDWVHHLDVQNPVDADRHVVFCHGRLIGPGSGTCRRGAMRALSVTGVVGAGGAAGARGWGAKCQVGCAAWRGGVRSSGRIV